LKQPSPKPLTINQHLVGGIAASMLIGAGVLWYVAGAQNMWTGACLKVGLVMGALWIALPSISRRNSWGRTSWSTVLLSLGVALVLTGKRVDMRLIIPLLMGVMIAVMILRPGSKSRSR
jgi:hypothetical protein